MCVKSRLTPPGQSRARVGARPPACPGRGLRSEVAGSGLERSNHHEVKAGRTSNCQYCYWLKLAIDNSNICIAPWDKLAFPCRKTPVNSCRGRKACSAADAAPAGKG